MEEKNTAIVTDEKYLVETSFGPIKLTPKTISDFLVNGNAKVNDQEIMMFLALCKGQKLNPFMKEVYLIKYSDKSLATMVVSKDVFFKRASSNPNYNGLESGIFVENAKGEMIKKENQIKLESEKLIGAWAKVHIKGRDFASSVEVNFDEYVGKKADGTPNNQWATRPIMMIIKVAEVQALKKAFPVEFDGMNDTTELEATKDIMAQEIIEKDKEIKNLSISKGGDDTSRDMNEEEADEFEKFFSKKEEKGNPGF